MKRSDNSDTPDTFGLSPDAMGSLRRFEALLRRRGPDLGLLSEADAGRVWERHVLDSLRALAGIRSTDRSAYDLGSGAGLPGIAVAIARPRLEVRLVESQRRRVAWLELARDDLELHNVSVVHGRVEDLTDPVDACFARAFAPVARSWELARPLLSAGGRLIYFAGRSFARIDALGLAPNVEILDDLADGVDSGGPLVIIGIE